MKIVHIITALGFGGGERLLTNTANIQCLTNEVSIIYLKDITDLQELLNPNIKTYYVSLSLKAPNLVRKILKAIKPDIIHTHLGHADLIGLWASRGLDSKLFCTMHNIWFKWNKKDYFIFALYTLLFKTVARNCKVICISQAVMDHVRNRLLVNKRNAFLLYNAIPKLNTNDYNKSELREQYNIQNDKFCILFVGRLELQKSVDTLLYAVNEIKNNVLNLQVNIIGEGKLKFELEDLSKTLGLENLVYFRGVNYKPEEYFALSDIFILPSIFEGFGLVILEAFRADLPVIATNIEGPKELITHGLNGLLFKPKAYKVLAKQIENLYNDKQSRDTLAHNGKLTFSDKFSLDQYVIKLSNIYKNA